MIFHQYHLGMATGRTGSGFLSSDRIHYISVRFGSGPDPGPENEDPDSIYRFFSGFGSGSGLFRIFKKNKIK